MDDTELIESKINDLCQERVHSWKRKPTVTGHVNTNREKRKQTWKPLKDKDPIQDDVKRMLSKALKIGIKMVMKNHLYKFNNTIKLQKEVGAISPELTGEVANVFMSWSDKEMMKKMME